MTLPNGSIPILDHGYIKQLEAWGSDAFIVETARVSTQGGFKGWGPKACPDCYSPAAQRSLGYTEMDGSKHSCGKCLMSGQVAGDEKLLRYLYENKHSTPFEFAGLTIEIQAPIFVFREWHRHRTQSYSEASARYAPLENLNYVPSVERLMMSGGTNKQAGAVKGSEALSKASAELFRTALAQSYEYAELGYQKALSDGVPKELARLVLPVGRYSKMRATANMRNWLAFLTLRSAPNAQWEIQQYANAVGDLLRDQFPRTMQLFEGK